MKLNTIANRILNILFPVQHIQNFFFKLFFRKLYYFKGKKLIEFKNRIYFIGLLAFLHSALVMAFLLSFLSSGDLSEIGKYTNYRTKGGFLTSYLLIQIRPAISPYIVIGYLFAFTGIFVNKIQGRNFRKRISRLVTKEEWGQWNKLNDK